MRKRFDFSATLSIKGESVRGLPIVFLQNSAPMKRIFPILLIIAVVYALFFRPKQDQTSEVTPVAAYAKPYPAGAGNHTAGAKPPTAPQARPPAPMTRPTDSPLLSETSNYFKQPLDRTHEVLQMAKDRLSDDK